ncbi:hypothetical protein WA026_013234 [Henosepilachna vigintioctopunctata]|uniref:Uncharacterized protein n=1 Tax=Henosepilachna vigintioctopunctata TaxID=420089 RepID=A0AAW1UI64_9CUCU
MPLPTSDFRNPVCLEMRTIKAEQAEQDLIELAQRQSRKKENGGGDLGSVDSSDTFESCRTHPFNSQGDLISPDISDTPCVLDSNLYVNPLDKSTDNSPDTFTPNRPGGVKKSASGDTALRSLGTSPSDEGFKGFGPLERGSRVSLNESPLPKSRRTRFQQTYRQRTRFGDSTDKNSADSLEGSKKKPPFMTTRSLASATRIINQHLFGLQSLGTAKSGKTSSKSSLSTDSIDSRQSPQLEHHRRNKSILKKSESSGNKNGGDPESERLISDNMSLYDIGSGSEYSPNKRFPSPPMRHKTAKTLPSYQQELERTRNLKSQLAPRSQFTLLDDIMKTKGKQQDAIVVDSNRLTECSQIPLYICPPPPPLEDSSPTEETSLLLHSTVTVPNTIATIPSGNSICKRPRPS